MAEPLQEDGETLLQEDGNAILLGQQDGEPPAGFPHSQAVIIA